MSRLMRVMYDFRAEEEGELSVRAGQIVMEKGEDTEGSDHETRMPG
jgi:hypothetical protein